MLKRMKNVWHLLIIGNLHDFWGRIGQRKGNIALVVGCALSPTAIEGDNFMFICDHNILQWQTMGCGLEEIPQVNE